MQKIKYAALFFIILTICSCYKEEFISVEMLKNKALSGDKEAVKKLVGLFDADDITTRSDAYKAVVEVKDDAVDILLYELDTAKGDKMEYIIASLGMIKAKRATDKLIAVLKGKDKRRYVAAFSLGQINDNKGARALIEALDDKDPEVKKYAAIAIIKNPQGDTGSDDPLDVAGELIKFLKRDDVKDKNFALSVIGELKDIRTFEAVLQEVDGKFMAQAVWALGKLKDPRAVDALIKKLKHPDWDIRVAAARSLGSIHSKKAVEALERNLDDQNVFVREWAARALEDITGEDYKYRREDGELVIPTSLYR
jgi:HEAT repeat protein